MARARIQINGVDGDNDDLPINTLVQLNNNGNGGETTYLWSILDQEPGTADALSNATIQNPTFTPKKEGSYLLRLIVNQGTPSESTDTVIAAVRFVKSRERKPAAGEQVEMDVRGWAISLNSMFAFMDNQLGNPGVVVGVNQHGSGLARGDVVRITSAPVIKSGLPGQELVAGFVKALATSFVNVTEPLYVVEGTPSGSSSVANGALVKVRAHGRYTGMTVSGSPAVGTPIFVSATGALSQTPGNPVRKIGHIISVSGSNAEVWIDGRNGPRLREGVSVVDFGAKGDGSTDDAPAFQAAVNAMNSGASIGNRLIVPRPAVGYRFASSVHVQRQIVLQGETGSGWFGSSIILPDKKVTAFVIDRPSTSLDGQRGDWSIIRDLVISYASTSTEWIANHAYNVGDLVVSSGPDGVSHSDLYTMECTTGGTTGGSEPHWDATTPLGGNTLAEGATVNDGSVVWTMRVIAGIRLHARAKVENVYITGSSGNGILIAANSGWTPSTNANVFKIADSLIASSKLNGIYVIGADTNAGKIDSVDCTSNRLWGFFDASFLGNKYVACHAATNGTNPLSWIGTPYGGPYRTVDANAHTSIDGCYSEQDQNPSDLAGGAGWVTSGLHGAGFSQTTTYPVFDNGNVRSTGLTFKDPRSAQNPNNVKAVIPGSGPYAFNITSDHEGSTGFTFADNGPTNYEGWWIWRHANSDSRKIMAFSGSASNIGPGWLWLTQGAFLGSTGGHRCFFEMGTTKPSGASWVTPFYLRGSTRFNDSRYAQVGGQPGVLMWQDLLADASNATIQTVRLPHFGFDNQIDVTNGVGSPFVIDSLDHAGCVFTNYGASAKTYLNLEQSTGVPDYRTSEFGFYVIDSDGMRIVAPSGRRIRWGAFATANAGYLESTTIGSWLKLKLVGTSSDPEYQVVDFGGDWTDGVFVVSESGVNIRPFTTNQTLATNGTRQIITNTGASGDLEHALPAARVGDVFEFIITAAHAITFRANGTDTIRVAGGSVSPAGGALQMVAQGDTARFVCAAAGKWLAACNGGVVTLLA